MICFEGCGQTWSTLFSCVHISDNDSVMSVIGTLYHMFEQLEIQQESNDDDEIMEHLNELLKQSQDDH